MKHSFRTDRAFTLVETMVAMLLVFVVFITAVGVVIFSRQALELNKQRLAAMNYCRGALEAVGNMQPAPAGVRELAEYRMPGITPLNGTLTVEYHPIKSDVLGNVLSFLGGGDGNFGKVDWSDKSVTEPPLDVPTLVRVTVEWTPGGITARKQKVSMQTMVTRGLI